MPKYNLPIGALESGSAYSFQLQVTDVSGSVFYSNTLVLSAPVIESFVGVDSGLNIQLEVTSDILSGSDEVDIVLKRADNVAFHIFKPFSALGAYQLRSSDNALLVNSQSYRVACKFEPSSDVYYTAPSMFNSITCTPTNVPNAPASVTVTSVGNTSLDMKVAWTRPSDFSGWSSSAFTIGVKLSSSLGVDQFVTFSSDVLQYTWVELDRGSTYTASVQYINGYGAGPYLQAVGFITLKCYPDPPTIVSASTDDGASLITWSAPVFTGQTAITAYTVYKDATPVITVNAST